MKKCLEISSKVRLAWRAGRVALVYDWVDKWGGAEQLLLALHRVFPEAPLFTSIYDPTKATWAKDFRVIPTWLNKLPMRRHEQIVPLIPLAIESFDFGDFDCVISVSSAFAKGIVTRPETLHANYCLTPTRFLWGDRDLYEKRLPELLRSVRKPVFSYLQSWDRVAAQRPDVIVAISNYVADGVLRYYNRKVAGVIYPPVPQLSSGSSRRSRKRDYFLVVSRLVPYKRVDLVVRAFAELKLPLLVVGTGVEEGFLRRMATENVVFKGEVGEDKKRDLYEGALAVIIPQREDFGLVGLEAASCGVPVVAFRGGGNLETVREGVSGTFFSEQTSESLAKAIAATDFLSFSRELCQKQANKFTFERFESQWIDLLTDRWG